PPWKTNNNVSLGNAVTIGVEGAPGVANQRVNTSLSLNGNPIYVYLPSVVTPDGSLHTLANANSGTLTLDGSGFGGSQLLTDRRGTKFNGTTAEDANGNQINFGTGTDTLGRQIPLVPGPATAASTPPASTASLSACPALGYAFQPVSYAYTWNL